MAEVVVVSQEPAPPATLPSAEVPKDAAEEKLVNPTRPAAETKVDDSKALVVVDSKTSFSLPPSPSLPLPAHHIHSPWNESITFGAKALLSTIRATASNSNRISNLAKSCSS